MNSQAPAGWYPQPDGTQRYWDGSQWTEHVAPSAAAATPAAAAPAEATPQPVPPPAPAAFAAPVDAVSAPAADAPWFKKKRFIIPGAALVAVMGISAIANAGGTPTAEPSSTPSETAMVVEDEVTPTPAAEVTTFVMPDLVGQNLQDAQDSLQALGSYILDQTDASGQDRMQLDDDNWQVCTQDPAPGTEVSTDATVQLGSVKNDESCTGEPAVAEPDTSGLTAEQVQAVGKAEDYLAFTSFSKNGLIAQLKYDGFSKADATAAIETLKVDWTAQAELKAQDYLDFTAFSKSGLIDQLKYDKFSSKQATAGVEALDVDWNEQAAKKAEDYLDTMNFSKKELIAQLKYEGFTTKQAQYGVKEAGL